MVSGGQQQEKGRQEPPRRRGRAVRRSRAPGQRELSRLMQLAVCLAVFLAALVGRGAFPEQLGGVRDRLLTVLGMDTDFKAVFAGLGRAVSQGEPVLDALSGLWVDTSESGNAYHPAVRETQPYLKEREFIAQPLTAEDILIHRFGMEAATPTAAPTPEPAPSPTPEPTPTPEPEVIHMAYSGPALPEGASMDLYRLDLDYMSPIQGEEGWWVSSKYGWRDHPVDGQERFHQGVDLAVNLGTPVKAFADGEVDYVGESAIYGRYVQLKHADGVTTFYAHCNAIYVKKGQTVVKGKIIAQSGQTGNVTGPHLHFELRKDGVLLNPLYYIGSTR